jgi:hypothetical protein
VEAPLGGVEAHPGAVEAPLEVWILTLVSWRLIGVMESKRFMLKAWRPNLKPFLEVWRLAAEL